MALRYNRPSHIRRFDNKIAGKMGNANGNGDDLFEEVFYRGIKSWIIFMRSRASVVSVPNETLGMRGKNLSDKYLTIQSKMGCFSNIV